MSKRVRNWLLGGLITAAFILGVPALQYVFAGTGVSNKQVEDAVGTSQAPRLTESHIPAARVGDQYVRIIPVGDESVQVILYDPELGVMTANENETILTFSLPNGKKKTLKVAAYKHTEGCSTQSHSTEGDACCPAPDKGTPHEECNHE